MSAGVSRPLIFAVIAVLAIALMHSSSSVIVQGKPLPGGHIDCIEADFFSETCCWIEWRDVPDSGVYCQTCHDVNGDGSDGYEECDFPEKQHTPTDLQQPPTPPGPGKGGPGNVLPEGVFEGPQTSPSPEGPTELTPQVDCAQNPEDPLCETATIPEGEQEETTEEPAIEEEQPSEESDSEDNDSNN